MGIGKRLMIASGLMALGFCMAPSGCGPVNPPGGGGAGGTSPSDAGACGCFSQTLTWGPNGGYVAWTDSSSIRPCRTYTHERDYNDGRPKLTCSRAVQDCATALAGTRLDALLQNNDVRAAFLRGAVLPVLYGRDTRHMDVPVLRIALGGMRIDVGGQCGSTPECEPVPAGVQSLVDLLRGLDQQELSGPACADSFP